LNKVKGVEEEEKEEAMSNSFGSETLEKNDYQDKDISELFQHIEQREIDTSFDIYQTITNGHKGQVLRYVRDAESKPL